MFVVSGPSGVGKGTVVGRLRSRRPELAYSPSYTTRGPRPGEVDGDVYRFVSDEEFDRLVGDGAFLEWAHVFGHRSGTLARAVQEQLRLGRDVIKETDVQGAAQIRERAPAAVLVFLAPPSDAELERRLRSRRTEDEAGIQRRLAAAREEMARRQEFDHIIVNLDVDRSAEQLARIIDGYRRKETDSA